MHIKRQNNNHCMIVCGLENYKQLNYIKTLSFNLPNLNIVLIHNNIYKSIS